MPVPALRISGRIVLGFSIPLALALGVMGFGVIQLASVQEHARRSDALAVNMQHVLEATHLLETVRRAEAHYRAEVDADSLAERATAITRTASLLARSAGASRSPDQRRGFEALLTDLREHDASFTQLVALSTAAAAAETALAASGHDVYVRMTAVLKAAREDGDPAVVAAANNAERQLLATRLACWRFQTTLAPTGPAIFRRDATAARDALAGLAARAGPALQDPIAGVGAAFDALNAEFATASDAILGSVALNRQTLVPQIIAMQAALAALGVTMRGNYNASALKAEIGIAHAILLERGISVLLLAGGAVLAALIGRGIARPIRDMTRAMALLAAGNKTIAIPARTRLDEIGDMARAVAVFKESMIRADRLTGELKQQITRREEAEARAANLARHDPLTGLPNRRLFAEDITRRLATVSEGNRLAMMLIDLDGFKGVNDVHGHQAGDSVLQSVVARLKSVLPPEALVARLGGDEFAILMPPGHDQHELERAAYRIITVIGTHAPIEDAAVSIGASIGITFAPTDGADASTLLRAADIAMYRAKAQGGGAMCFFAKSMDTEMRAHAALREELRTAITTGQVVPYYQPLVDLRRNSIAGFEILARWVHPAHGVLGPHRFIPLVEQMRLNTPMTLSLLRQACVDARHWPQHIRLSLNIAPAQLREARLLPEITAVLRAAGFATHRLELELVEDALTGDIDEARDFINAAHAVGMTVALDDFGTGHSSLSRLHELPLDKVKIDRSFMQRLAQDDKSAAYVAAIVNLGKTLELHTTAEGIEDEAVMWTLEGMGCDFGQGYLYAAPVPAAEVCTMLDVQCTDDDQKLLEQVGPEPPVVLRRLPA